MNRLRTAAHRAPIFLGLGSVLATGALAPGCRSSDDPAPTSQADLLPEKGVRTRISEVAPGRYVIDEETLVDTATHVVVQRLDGTAERITDPDRFAALLVPPDSARVLAAAFAADTLAPVSPGTAVAPAPAASAYNGGGGGTWDGSVPPEASTGASSGEGTEPRVYGSGFPLGQLLFFSLAMNAWRPAAYGGAYASAPRMAYRDDDTRTRSSGTASGFAAAQRTGQAPQGLEDARSRHLARSRATTRTASPSNGRSGYGRSWGRSGG